MSTLSERLHDLADLADASSEHPAPHDTWVRGVRFRRRRRIGTAVIALVAVLALAGITSLSLVRSHDPVQPAGSNTQLGIPDRLYEPSPWLPGTDDEGPLGPLAVLIPAERKSWSGSVGGVVGVSATTGEYRFLDLPDDAHQGSALSPDGRHVVYWTAGPIAGDAHPGQDPVVGAVAVYDTTTGEVRRGAIPTEHGVAPNGLEWLDSETAVVELGSWMDYDPRTGDYAARMRSRIWHLTDPEPVVWRAVSIGSDVTAVGRGAALIQGQDGRQSVVSTDGSARPVTFRQPFLTAPVLDEAGRRLAGITNAPNRLRIVDLDGVARVVPGTNRTSAVYGWADTTHVAILQNDRVTARGTVRIVDVRTGDAVEVSSHVTNVQDLARDLLGAPALPAVEPPHPLDPRKVTGLTTAVAVAGVLALILWRRRVRP